MSKIILHINSSLKHINRFKICYLALTRFFKFYFTIEFLKYHFVCKTYFRNMNCVQQNEKLKELVLPTEFLEDKWIMWLIHSHK